VELPGRTTAYDYRVSQGSAGCFTRRADVASRTGGQAASVPGLPLCCQVPVTVIQVSAGGGPSAAVPRISTLLVMASAAQQETRRRVRYQVPSSPRERRPEDGGDRGDCDQRGADDDVHERAYGEAQPVGHRPSIFHARLSRSVYVCPAKVRRAVL
jgi:hypothetical protein